PLRPGALDEGGAILGAGGVTVLDDSLSPIEAVRHLTAYNAAESCGKCTPCREGTARTEMLLALAATRLLQAGEREQLAALNETIRLASLCGLGQAAPNPVTSLLRHWPDGGSSV
ncbi:MAG TPA: NADH-ubiquinone oxidoreductase-F iron-sulfur binding region domain-containing protein, partial [Dehalococcoidia bacterium]|nr:NADH-ubiquinone oxidoreductase-F iron-sulfur binding region domain-containing protein [Dehalococcoidia bacterium]